MAGRTENNEGDAMRYLVTGSAGFIGFHTCVALLMDGHDVVGLDNFNSYYDPLLKKDRVACLYEFPKYMHKTADITDGPAMLDLIQHGFDYVIHLAAQAGVRYSLEQPHDYIDTNIKGFQNILDAIRETPENSPRRLLYASSSSVYGSNKSMPFKEGDRTDGPSNIYATTKKTNELQAEAYHQLFGIRSTALRFFTVYGPWGRPDMALFKFADAISRGKSIDLYNGGDHQRDWTYVSDIVSGIQKIIEFDIELPPVDRFNLCSNDPTELKDFVSLLGKELDRPVGINLLPLQQGDIQATWGDNDKLRSMGWSPRVLVDQGISRFVNWYQKYYAKRNGK